jgi:hypothetical protein
MEFHLYDEDTTEYITTVELPERVITSIQRLANLEGCSIEELIRDHLIDFVENSQDL